MNHIKKLFPRPLETKKGRPMISSRLNPADVDRFIRSQLRKALQDDYRRHKMMREEDFECCAYHDLRDFLERDDHWRVFAKKYSKAIGRYPDLTILKDHEPVRAIELKWRRKSISTKDRDTLRACLRRMATVRKVYFITTVLDKADYRKLGLRKKADEKYRLREITVRLDLPALKRKRWEEERDRYKRAFA